MAGRKILTKVEMRKLVDNIKGASKKEKKADSDCFYCSGNSTNCVGDHFPARQSDGGVLTVPCCMGCHKMKDMISLSDVSHRVLEEYFANCDWEIALYEQMIISYSDIIMNNIVHQLRNGYSDDAYACFADFIEGDTSSLQLFSSALGALETKARISKARGFRIVLAKFLMIGYGAMWRFQDEAIPALDSRAFPVYFI